MCVLEKLMNKSIGGDYDWCLRNKQATIGCCRKQCGGQINCRWTNCRFTQTVHSFHHMCIVFLMTDYSFVICSLNTLFFCATYGISYWMRQRSPGSLNRQLCCFPKTQILGLEHKLWLAHWRQTYLQQFTEKLNEIILVLSIVMRICHQQLIQKGSRLSC